jgi:hypothetical protein
MTLPRVVPIFDGHNDVLLRLYRHGGTHAPRAFLEGGADGTLIFQRLFKADSLEDCSPFSFRHPRRKPQAAMRSPKLLTTRHDLLLQSSY